MNCTRASWLGLAFPGLWFVAGCGGPAPEPPAARAPVSTAGSVVWPTTETAQRGAATHVAEPPRVRLVHVCPIPFGDVAGMLSPTHPTAYVEETQSVLRDMSGTPINEPPSNHPASTSTPPTPAGSTLSIHRFAKSPIESEQKPVERLTIGGSSQSEPHVAPEAVVRQPVERRAVVAPAPQQPPVIADAPVQKPQSRRVPIEAPKSQPRAAAAPIQKPDDRRETVERAPSESHVVAVPAQQPVERRETVERAPSELHVGTVATPTPVARREIVEREPSVPHIAAVPVQQPIERRETVETAPNESHVAAVPAQQPVARREIVERAPSASHVTADPAPAQTPPEPRIALDPAGEDARACPIPEVHRVEPADDKVESERLDVGRPDRTPELLAICKRAEGINRHGYEMAQRGAIFSARQDYMQSLQTIAAALDAQRASHSHQKMLAAGFKALEEADDFAAIDIRSGAELDIATIAIAHQTPVMRDDTRSVWSAQAAMGRYLTYAQEQLAGAVGDIPQASAALFGLGKVYSVPAAAHGPKDLTGGAKAVAFYQASLMVDGRNFMAANELGVALVQFGRLKEARAAFLHSVSISSQPVVWQNLAALHQILGENKLAEQARQTATVAANQAGKGSPALTTFDLQWVDPATFVRSMPLESDPIKASPTPTPQPQQHKSIADMLPWSSSSRRQ
jgi:hypothetical protein